MGKGYVSSVLLFISTNERYTLNLSDYDSVTKYQNLRYSMNLSITEPNYASSERYFPVQATNDFRMAR